MQLAFQNGYPLNVSAAATNDEIDDAERTRGTLRVVGVDSIHYQPNSITVTFGTRAQCEAARRSTGWIRVRPGTLRSPPHSSQVSAIAAGGFIYSDFDLLPDDD